jgi:hypothetical protein
MRLSKGVVLIGVMFIVILVFISNFLLRKEGFQEAPSPQTLLNMIRQIQMAGGQLDKQDSYNQWVGYLYKNVGKSSKPLNDFKSRVFDDSCKFRYDWSTSIPEGLSKPLGANSREMANAAYTSYMNCLKDRNPACIQQLEDARTRFMKPGCYYKYTGDGSSLTKNIREVFP